MRSWINEILLNVLPEPGTIDGRAAIQRDDSEQGIALQPMSKDRAGAGGSMVMAVAFPSQPQDSGSNVLFIAFCKYQE